MKPVVIDEPGKVRLNEIAEPELKNDEVLLEIQYIGTNVGRKNNPI